MRLDTKRLIAACGAALLMTTGRVALAEEPALAAPSDPNEDKWVFNSPLYIWASGMDGSVTARGNSTEIDYSFSDLNENMELGFQGYFELAKKKYGFYAQPSYMKLAVDGSTGPIDTEVTSEMWIVEFGAFYKFLTWEGKRPGSLAAVAGGRYWSINNDLKVKAPLGTANFGDSNSLFDPILGLRYHQYFTKKFHVWMQGDVGGFDISSSQSRFSWQVMPMVAYDFNMIVINKPSTVFLGYRILGIQHSEGSGANEHSFNIRLNGLLVGLNVQLF
ncbi:MAG: hypothetical protein PCFJNLEI_02563 [Verrucomicrobiae bacterium]|nr:hypothetical protein [Verrucomicrobiae bacterium]